MALQIGANLGRYRLEELVGQGGMAVVYRATDELLGRTVAVKVIRPSYAEDTQFLDRFLQEARLVAGLDHPNILPVFDFGEQNGSPYLVLPFLRGGTLAERLDGRRQPLPQVAAWLVQLGAALDAAHSRGVLHRDVKPGNVLVGGDGRLILGDFGIARLAEANTRLTATGMVVGTPAYMAPELARGTDASPASDRYALAVIAFEAIAGRQPFVGSNPLSILHQQVNEPVPRLGDELPDLPSAVDGWLQRGLAKDPEGRPPSARALADELVQLLAPDQRAELSALVWTGGIEVSAANRADAPTVLTPGGTLPLADPEAPTLRRPVGGAGTGSRPTARLASGLPTAATPLATPLGRPGSRYGRPWWPWAVTAAVVAAAGLWVARPYLVPDAAEPAPGARADSGTAREGAPALTAAGAPTAPVLSGTVDAGTAAAGGTQAATAPAPEGSGSLATAAPSPGASPTTTVSGAPVAAAAAEAREALGFLRRPSHRLGEAEFRALEVGAGRAADDPRWTAAMTVGQEWARGGAAYAAGRDDEAERIRQSLLSTLPATPAAPWGIAWPAMVFQDDDPAIARALLYADARDALRGLVAALPASPEGRHRVALAKAQHRHLEGDHAGAIRAVTGAGIEPTNIADARTRALVAQLLVAEAIELGDPIAARRWRSSALGGGAPLVRPFLLEILGIGQQTLSQGDLMALRLEGCRAGIPQLCRGGGQQPAVQPSPGDGGGRPGPGPRAQRRQQARTPGDGGGSPR
jgi:tRNA A-37 threonylcarbamoyl transferase component Bud32